jgi:hypothetical protein
MIAVEAPNNRMATAPGSKRTLLAAVVAAGGIAATMFLGTAVANADAPAAGRGPCEAAGGTYSQTSAGVESCCFQEAINSQGHHCYVYVAGVLSGTNFVQPPSPTATVHPVQPLPGTAPAAPGALPVGPQSVQPLPGTTAPVIP